MGVSRDLLEQLRHLVQPVAIRVANLAARAVVQVVNDTAAHQVVQLGVLDGESLDDCENFQGYGFSSVPLSGAEAVAIFPNGDRAHPLIVATDDRRHRPTGLSAGEVAVYNDAGAMVKLTVDGDIEVIPASGRKVLVKSPGGSTDALVTKGEFERHTHVTAGTGSPVGPTEITPPALSYTTVLEGE